jgi:signal transduction histidine kinase
VSGAVVFADRAADTTLVDVRTLMFAYAAHSAIVATLVRYWPRPLGWWQLVFHVLDVLWAAMLTAATGGPNSPLFVLFPFALLGAAYRWGLRETIWTGLIVLGLFTVEANVAVHTLFGGPAVRFEYQVVLLRGTYLLIGAIVLGYVAEEQLLHHAETAITTNILSHIQAETGFRSALRHVVRELLTVFDARRLIIVAVESDSGRTVWWEAWLRNRQLVLALESGDSSEARRDTLRFPAPGDALRIIRKRHRCELVSLDLEGGLVGKPSCEVPESFWSSPEWRSAIVVKVEFADHWNGRVVLLFNRIPGLCDVRLMQRLICQASPVMYNHYLLRRLRTRVAAAERRRVARELHDGVVQSLAGLEMHLAALRRSHQAQIRAAGLDEELSRIQQLLAEEARGVRDVMYLIRPLDIARGQLVRSFADLVSRFERDTGIKTHFSADIDSVDVPPLTARELGRTLQEALRNVRKHSGARHVDVEFTRDNGNLKLVVANDGRPFDFSGRWTLDELEKELRGPRVIKERVREMGGDLAIESAPARGVRLEVTVPHRHSHA